MADNRPQMNTQGKDFVPNKALGQNFLVRPDIVESILDAAQVESKRVLEIGPGTGALTQGLLSRASYLAAIEKDGRLCGILQERFGERLALVHADALDTDIPALMGDLPWHAVGNLPYYATTPIVLLLLALLPESMTLMVQREAAERFFAKPKERVYGPVAVLTACFYDSKVILNVPRDSFQPAPEVDSVVVRLVRNQRPRQDGAQFLAFLKQAFSMRRKTLHNNLRRDERLPAVLEENGYPLEARAEALPPEALLKIHQALAGNQI